MQKTKIAGIECDRLIINQLNQIYTSEKHTAQECALILECSERTIYNYLFRLNIPKRGLHWSEEQKQLRRDWWNIHPNHKPSLGKKHSLNTKQNMSSQRQGEKNANWRGGLTAIKRGIKRSAQYYQWRKTVLTRDKYTCQRCGQKNVRLAHHILPFKEFQLYRFDINNGITLCEDCHKLTHKEVWRASKKQA